MSGFVIAGTGHRPEDLPESEIGVRSKIRLKLQWSLEKGDKIDEIISGMAAGFDLWFADEALNIGLPVIAARPWVGHRPRKGDEELYERVMTAANCIVNVDPSEKYPGPWVYPKRNHYMVDEATHLLAYYTGVEKGGTYECYSYAKLRQEQGHDIKIYNLINDPPF